MLKILRYRVLNTEAVTVMLQTTGQHKMF